MKYLRNLQTFNLENKRRFCDITENYIGERDCTMCLRKISGSHVGKYEDNSYLEYCTAQCR